VTSISPIDFWLFVNITTAVVVKQMRVRTQSLYLQVEQEGGEGKDTGTGQVRQRKAIMR
jgi:hypothetical protein